MDYKNKALLVDLTISVWTGRKYDFKVTSEVNRNHNTKDAGRFNKLLVDKKALQPIQSIANKIRTYHNNYTLPWGKSGERILPSESYLDYVNGLRELIREYEVRVEEFIQNWENIKGDAAEKLNGLYNESDYPRNIENRFGIEKDVFPIPDSNDFRLGIVSDEVKAEIESDAIRSIDGRHNQAIEHIFTRVQSAISEVTDALERLDAKENARFHKSTIEKVRNLCDMIPKLNYIKDAKVAKLGNQLKSFVADRDTLRNDPDARKNYLERARQLNEMFFN